MGTCAPPVDAQPLVAKRRQRRRGTALGAGTAHRRARAAMIPGMSASTQAVTAPPLSAEERLLRERVLKWILIVAIVDLILFLPLVYGLIAGDDSFSPIFGPIHGTGFVIEVLMAGYGAAKKWWGWWYPIVTFITTGWPGVILGHPKAKREAFGGFRRAVRSPGIRSDG
jgi:hypothetical protein